MLMLIKILWVANKGSPKWLNYKGSCSQEVWRQNSSRAASSMAQSHCHLLHLSGQLFLASWTCLSKGHVMTGDVQDDKCQHSSPAFPRDRWPELGSNVRDAPVPWKGNRMTWQIDKLRLLLWVSRGEKKWLYSSGYPLGNLWQLTDHRSSYLNATYCTSLSANVFKCCWFDGQRRHLIVYYAPTWLSMRLKIIYLLYIWVFSSKNCLFLPFCLVFYGIGLLCL